MPRFNALERGINVLVWSEIYNWKKIWELTYICLRTLRGVNSGRKSAQKVILTLHCALYIHMCFDLIWFKLSRKKRINYPEIFDGSIKKVTKVARSFCCKNLACWLITIFGTRKFCIYRKQKPLITLTMMKYWIVYWQTFAAPLLRT